MIDAPNVYFLDIESVPMVEKFKDLDPTGQGLFKKKFHWKYFPSEDPLDKEIKIHASRKMVSQEFLEQMVWEKEASLHAEFNRIVCICVGRLHLPASGGKELVLTVKSFTGTEPDILNKFCASLVKSDLRYICAHNGKGFDFPVLIRKMIMYGMSLPEPLVFEGRKSWELPWIDTQEIWAAGEWKYRVALATLAYCLSLPSPKENMSGADVAPLFFTGCIADIVNYCAGDVFTLVNCYLKLAGRVPFSTFTLASDVKPTEPPAPEV